MLIDVLSFTIDNTSVGIFNALDWMRRDTSSTDEKKLQITERDQIDATRQKSMDYTRVFAMFVELS